MPTHTTQYMKTQLSEPAVTNTHFILQLLQYLQHRPM